MINGKGGNMMRAERDMHQGKRRRKRKRKRKEKKGEFLIENMMGVCAKARGGNRRQ